MKKLLLAAVALSAFATPALADPQASWNVTGTVAAQCGAIAGNDADLAFGSLNINASDGTLAANGSKSTTSQDVYCNGGSSTISVAATPMTNQTNTSAEDSNFTGTINYTTDVNFAGSHFGVGATQSLGAKAGTLVVTTSNLTANNSKRPYAGDYQGTVTVTLTPGV